MQQDPIKAAEAEIKKWIDLIKQMFDEARKQAEKLAAEQKAIGEKALAANKEMMRAEAEGAKHDELMKELKGLREKVDGLPDGETKTALSEEVGGLEEDAARLEGDGYDMSELNEIAGPDVEGVFSDAPSVVDVSELNEVAGPGLEEAFSEGVGEAVEGLSEAVDELTEGLAEVADSAGKAISSVAGGGMDVGALAQGAGNLGGGGAPGLDLGGGGGGKQSVGESLGWTKGEKGWKNQEGLSVKELSSKVQIGASRGITGG